MTKSKKKIPRRHYGRFEIETDRHEVENPDEQRNNA